jgi:hypothetical protein
MAAAAKKKYVKFKTPPGAGVYTKLHKAFKWDDASERSLPNPDGDLSTGLRLSNKDAQPLLDTVKAAIKESGVKPKYLPYSDEVIDGKKTGNVLFKLKAYGKTKDGEINKIKFYDSAGTPLKGVINVTSGSTIALQGWISVAKMGARMNIRECQIIDLAEMQGEGFAAHEGGSFRADDLDDDEMEDETETKTADTTGEDTDSETEETSDASDDEF